MVFSEDSRVKIPCILHLIRIGYSYLTFVTAGGSSEMNYRIGD